MAGKKAKKKTTAKPLPKTKKFGDKNYKKSSCGKTKMAATKTAENFRDRTKKKYARVEQDPITKKWCVYKRG